MTDNLLSDLRTFLERHVQDEDREKSTLHSSNGAKALMERLEKRLTLPNLEDHEFVLDLEQDEHNPEKIIASIRAVSVCDRNECACHIGNFAEWGIVHGEVPISVKFDFGKYNSWMGDYDDTYIEVSAKLPKVSELPKVVLTPCTTEAT